MKNTAIGIAISSDQVIAIIGIVVPVVVAIVGGIYAIVTNTKKYELTENFRRELLDWYTETVSIMIEFIHYIQHAPYNEEYIQRKNELLCRLSAQIEVGRFYFPNVNKGDGFGDWKTDAYQGYRHINLEFLLHFYKLGSRANCKDYIDSLWEMERYFTSAIFRMIDPVKRNKKYSKYTEIAIPNGKSMEEYLKENPKNRRIFWK